jgi:predicted outer membrane protein
MTVGTLLQILLFLQVFVMGALAAIAWRYAYAHFKPAQTEHRQEANQPLEPIELPAEVKAHLLQASRAQFEEAVKNAASQLQIDLDSTNGQINELIMRLATEMVSAELARYKAELERLQNEVQTDMSGISAEVKKHEEELKAKITEELEAEKQRLIKQIDTKLADAVGSFLTETLQHNVDLGSQSAYLVQMLEEHKDEFIKEVGSEDQPAG